jgi:hypothetical protein
MREIGEAVDEMLVERLTTAERAWLDRMRGEIAAGVPAERLASLVSLASRHTPRGALDPSPLEIDRAERALPGWNPERWTALELARCALVLSHPGLAEPGLVEDVEELFRYADEGELCALHRCLPLLPGPERFVWRAGEGCRTNMRSVFEAVATDNPLPRSHFDDIAWQQLAMKAAFIDVPLSRVWGLDTRLSPELARMALDLADERRSAGRPIPPELWLCLGGHGGQRGLDSLERELRAAELPNRRAAALALIRAGARERLTEMLTETKSRDLLETLAAAGVGEVDQRTFAALVHA